MSEMLIKTTNQEGRNIMLQPLQVSSILETSNGKTQVRMANGQIHILDEEFADFEAMGISVAQLRELFQQTTAGMFE